MDVPLRIEPARAALLIIDIQERLVAAMPSTARASIERNVPVLIDAARRFDLPVVVSRQYPQGLGDTIAPVTDALGALGDTVRQFDKTEFSVCGTDAFTTIRSELGRDQWIVVGIETHVCVYQSARGLTARGAAVHVVGDAVASRTDANRDVGIALIERAGGTITSTEVVVFDLLRRAGGEHFKALSKRIR